VCVCCPGRCRGKWEDNFKIDNHEARCKSMNRIYLAEDGDQWQALVKTVMNIRVP
jgi:hypothetical protein